MNKVLVIGASGATGRLLVKLLLQKGVAVIAIVRNADSLQSFVGEHSSLQIIECEISQILVSDLALLVKECEAVLCCLGHNLTFKGIFGHPRRLVTDAVKKVTQSIESTNHTGVVKIILMNTTGNSNRDIPEKPPLSQRIVVSILRLLLPPHIDNENAADFLRLHIGSNHQSIEWTAVRPDGLTNEEDTTPYDIYPSPTRNAIFDAGVTSRINVAHFMCALATDTVLWDEWKGKMPVIYNHA